jgi:hypothetical protein
VNDSHNSPEAQPGALHSARRPRKREAGYAYIMALFMVLTVIIGSQAILRSMVAEAKSQREDDVIWRGDQYVRAIKLYYRKTGHFPQTQDDLLNGVGNVHFLRSEVIKDPLNKSDGSWRFIYTNASGAIIGSVKYGSMAEMAMMDLNGGVMPGTTTGTTTGANGQPTSPTGATGPNGPGTATGANGPGSAANPTGSGFSLSNGFSVGSSPTTVPTGQGNGSTVLGILGQPVTGGTALGPPPTGPVDGPVFGGMLVGVGSKVDEPSQKVYKGGTRYNQWEFIWNPQEEQAQAIQQGLNGANGGQPGVNGLGGIPGLSLGPAGSSPLTTPSPTTGTGGTNTTPQTTPTQ